MELACLILVQSGYIPTRVPSYSLSSPSPKFWAFLNEDFGAWHYKNAIASHTSACFNLIYTFNSYGARDIERSEYSSKKRIIVLGDSFVEGYGVTDSCRLTNLLETKTGIPHLNFGTSGGVGPTQYFMIYETLAKKYKHDAVILGILPDNDFQDDYPNSGRYQPYWEGKYPNYQISYTGKQYFNSASSHEIQPDNKDAKWYLRNFTYTMNVAEWIEGLLKVKRNIYRQNRQLPRRSSRFNDYTSEEFDRMRYSLEKVCQSAMDKPVVVFLIPRFSDLIEYGKSGNNKLLEELEKGVKEPNLILIDLLSMMHDYNKDRWTDYFLPCDRHWSCYGHEVASTILIQSLKDTLY